MGAVPAASTIDPTATSPAASDPATSFTAWLDAFVVEAGRDEFVADFVQVVDAAIMAELSVIRDDPMLAADLHHSTEAHWRSFVQTIELHEDAVRVPTAAHDLARTIARRGLELGVLLKLYRVANRAVWRFLTDLAESPPADLPHNEEALVGLYSWAVRWIDESIDQLIETFEREADLLGAGATTRRREIIEAILDGRAVSRDSGAALGHPLHVWHTAAVIWAANPQPGATAAPPDLQAAAQALAADLGTVLTIASGSRERWVWVATRTKPSRAELEPLAPPPGVRVAWGTPARDIAGFRSSHLEARAVQRVMLAARHAPTVVHHDDVDLLCLTLGNEEAAQRLVTHQLADLAVDTDSASQLRHTVLTWLTHGGRVDDAAAELAVHKNTVRYRLARAEELRGRPLTEQTAHLELALRHVALHGVPDTS